MICGYKNHNNRCSTARGTLSSSRIDSKIWYIYSEPEPRSTFSTPNPPKKIAYFPKNIKDDWISWKRGILVKLRTLSISQMDEAIQFFPELEKQRFRQSSCNTFLRSSCTLGAWLSTTCRGMAHSLCRHRYRHRLSPPPTLLANRLSLLIIRAINVRFQHYHEDNPGFNALYMRPNPYLLDSSVQLVGSSEEAGHT